MRRGDSIEEVEKEEPVIKVAKPTRKEVLTIRGLILVGCLSVIVFVGWFFSENRIGMPLLYWLLTFALLFKFFKLFHEWYHYWGLKQGVQPEEKAEKVPLFTVDVITTFCPGEPKELIKTTLLAIKSIRYPHETYLGDEANDPELRAFCHAHGIHHVSRNTRENAKAGNVNNVLSGAKGEICLILDPDHQPHPLILDRILPHFKEEAVGFVQSVQAYKNQKISLVAFGAAEQTYHFYGPLMMGMSNYGTAQAIGANCVFRRSALNSIGGHAAGLAEDMHTSMLLHAKGWKSIYVPEVLSRGLVPATLSAYYKQQLKWSRGTLELLFFVLPRIWSALNWRQRFHYLSLPLYYLAAFIMLIDLLVPVTALLISRTPWLVTLNAFLLFIVPVLCLTVLIRQYAQRWLLEHQERGFVLVGGLLKLGTWWVYLLGFATTLLRIKIPYIPTPKEDEPENEKALNLPNLLAAALCLFAIGYGLQQDFSPFSIIMATFALVNAIVLIFNILISQQKAIAQLATRFKRKEKMYRRSRRVRVVWWKTRHGVYSLMRTQVLVLLLLVFAFTALYSNWVENSSLQSLHFKTDRAAEPLFYKGIYLPAVQEEQNLAELTKIFAPAHFDPSIVSVYFPWWEDEEALPEQLLRKAKGENKLLMISWEPWQPALKGQQDGSGFLAEIVDGKYDAYLQRIARQLAAYGQPVFIRFAHEFDNPQYPWSGAVLQNPEQFKEAWQYLVSTFRREGAYNAIWVYNPWDPEDFEPFYPGNAYVDWLGITALNYGPLYADKKSRSFKEIYAPFKKVIAASDELKKKPLMLAEFGTYGTDDEQVRWLEEAETYLQKEEQLRAVVYFYSASDRNFPVRLADDTSAVHSPAVINWQFPPESMPSFSAKAIVQGTRQALKVSTERVRENKAMPVRGAGLQFLQGVIYQPVSYWNQAYLPLMRQQLVKDFSLMKSLQLNTVYRPVSDIYNRNVYRLAKEFDLQLIQEIEELSMVHDFRQYEQLVAWSVGQLAMDNRDFWSPKKQQAFSREVKRLSSLASSLKSLDDRPVLLAVPFSTLQRAAPFLFNHFRDVDVLGIQLGPSQDIEAVEQLWQTYKPAQQYYIQIESVDMEETSNEGFGVSDKNAADLQKFLKQQLKEEGSSCLGFIKENWMDKNLDRPEGGMVNFKGELKACYIDSLAQTTNIYLYSNDPVYALKGWKTYQLFAVNQDLQPSDNLHFEWYIFNRQTGDEEVFYSESPQQQQIFFTPGAGSSYDVILATYRNQQLLYNSYLKLKTIGPKAEESPGT